MTPRFASERLAAALISTRGKRKLEDISAEMLTRFGATVSASTLSRIENGKEPNLENLGLICAFLGKTPSDFYDHLPETAGRQTTLPAVRKAANRSERRDVCAGSMSARLARVESILSRYVSEIDNQNHRKTGVR